MIVQSGKEQINPELLMKLKRYVYPILGCCQEVHREMGPWLNEYMYQDALKIAFADAGISFQAEFRFFVNFHGHQIPHEHKLDFLVEDHVIIECKAITEIGTEQRQQLWNYLRLTNYRIGILYNFAPVKDQCEKYYYNPDTKSIFAF
jgi:GxxExxY protein